MARLSSFWNDQSTGRAAKWAVSGALLFGLISWGTLAQTSAEGDGVLEMLEQQLEQQQAIAEAQRAELAEVRGNLAALSAEGQARLAELDRLQADMDKLRGEGLLTAQRLQEAEAELALTTGEVEALEARTQTLRTSVRAGLASLYRERSSDYLALLSQSQTLPELMLHLQWSNYLGQAQVDMTAELERQTQRLEARLTEQQERRTELSELQAKRQANLQALAQAQARTEALLAELRSTAEGQRLLEVQGKAELQQTAANVDEVLGAMTRQRAELEASRQRDLAEAQARAERAAQLAAEAEAEAERQRQAEAKAGAGAEVEPPPTQSGDSTPQAPNTPPDMQATDTPQDSTAPPAPVAQASAAGAGSNAAAQSPDAAASASVATPQARQQQIAAQLAPVQGRLENFAFPVEGGRVSAAFSQGAPWAVIRSDAPTARARAAEEGVVLAAATFNSLGWVVLLDHGGDLVSAYMGLQQPEVRVGDRIARGRVLGALGGSPVFGAGAMGFQVSRVEGEARTPLPYTPTADPNERIGSGE